ncbi:MAG: hypothetical protein WCW25_00775 [Patescibacteria group bacterium]|jgi:hypothetical protein
MIEQEQTFAGHEPENLKNAELLELSFVDLEIAYKEIQRLAEVSFGRAENGFRNVQGNGVFMREAEGKFRLSQISPLLKEIHNYIATNPDSVLVKGSAKKEEMLSAIIDMLEKLDYRVIE